MKHSQRISSLHFLLTLAVVFQGGCQEKQDPVSPHAASSANRPQAAKSKESAGAAATGTDKQAATQASTADGGHSSIPAIP